MTVYYLFWFASIVGAFFVKSRLILWLYVGCVFIFIGLRYETGFDWSVYKEIFERLSADFSFINIARVQSDTGQETIFLFILSVTGWAFPSYEFAQAIFTFFLLYSVVKLCQAIPGARPAIVLALFFSLFLLAVGFSTVRQALAISFFNIALYNFLKGRSLWHYVFLALSVMVQASAAFYVIGLFVTRLLVLRGRTPGVLGFILISGFLAISLPALIDIASSLSPTFALRIDYYRELTFRSSPSLFSIVFLSPFFYIGVLAARKRSKGNIESPEAIFVRTLVVVFSSLVISSWFFETLRDRISYQSILLACIFISMRLNPSRFQAAIFLVFIGLLYQAGAILKYPAALAFVPYQNWVIMAVTGVESTGGTRSEQYMEYIHDTRR